MDRNLTMSRQGAATTDRAPLPGDRRSAATRSSAKHRVLFAASHGGHWVQLRRIANGLADIDAEYLTTTSDVAEEVGDARVWTVPDANLDRKLALVNLAWRVLWVVLRRRPDVVISTGAAPGFFAVAFGKLFGARTIWVDSLANAERLSVSGAKVRRFADLWLTQWPELERADGPHYMGRVL